MKENALLAAKPLPPARHAPVVHADARGLVGIELLVHALLGKARKSWCAAKESNLLSELLGCGVHVRRLGMRGRSGIPSHTRCMNGHALRGHGRHFRLRHRIELESSGSLIGQSRVGWVKPLV